ncbi:MAG: hypothetical protein GTN74_01425 [Proteobacteria bacterium]|nr:hypothetical protein [Pseudomonadota bacterium]NIS67773.1 hypothetical protein [Pseudomonadota bacterium]
MEEILFWLYLTNSVLLISHEIDSAYWKEWDLFRLPGGIAGFLILHFPLLFLIMYGLILVFERSFAGLMFSLILGFAGMFAFGIHMFLIRKGRSEFKTPISLFILITVLIVSLFQTIITLYLF